MITIIILFVIFLIICELRYSDAWQQYRGIKRKEKENKKKKYEEELKKMEQFMIHKEKESK